MNKRPWYSELGVISVGVQSGGPDDGGIFENKIQLFKIIGKHITESHSDEIKHFAIAFRVAGKFTNWGDDRIEKIRRDKAIMCIGCDIVVSQKPLIH